MVSEAVSALEDGINRSLRSGVNRACIFNVPFRTDVFRFLFKDKGKDCPHRFGHFYDLEDFDRAFFSSDWHTCYDSFGDGCTIDFPLRMHSKLQWSPKVYTKDSCGVLIPKKRSYSEICSVWISKKRC